MTEIYVIGVSMTPTGKHADSSVKSLTQDALSAALKDARLRAGALQCAYFSNSGQGHLEGQTQIKGQIALRSAGLGAIPVTNVENACASGSTAFQLAAQCIKAGEADCALAIGAEKMFIPDKARMFSLFDGGWDVHEVERTTRNLLRMGEGVVPPPGTTSDKPYSVFMEVYAALCRQHMKRWGTQQKHLAAIAAKNHTHSVHNERAQYRRPYSIEDVLGAPPVVYPLTLPMCAPMSDGAAAAILVSEAGLARLGADRNRAIRVRACVLASGSDRGPDDVDQQITVRLAKRAYEQAGLGPEDVSVAEVHDATAMGELLQSENLGFFAFGEGGPAALRGETRLGGRIPINPSGGLESKGHPIGATGLGQIFELVTQLRGEAGARQVEGARIALAENGGGMIGFEEAAAVITILER